MILYYDEKNRDETIIRCSEKDLFYIDLMVKIMLVSLQEHGEYRLFALGTQIDAFSVLRKIYDSIELKSGEIIVSVPEFHLIKESFNYSIRGSGDIRHYGFMLNEEDQKRIMVLLELVYAERIKI